MFTQFEGGNLLPESCNITESGDGYDDDSTLPPLNNDAKMDEISSGDEYDAEPMSRDMLEDISGGIQYHPSINRREARYKIRDLIKKYERNGKGGYYQQETWAKVHKKFKAVFSEIKESFPIMG